MKRVFYPKQGDLMNDIINCINDYVVVDYNEQRKVKVTVEIIGRKIK